MRKLLICPTCEIESKTSVYKWVGKGYGVEVRRLPFVLGEINDDGNVIIKRAQHGYTVVGGENFTISCDKCGEPCFTRSTTNVRYVYQIRSNAGTTNGTVT